MALTDQQMTDTRRYMGYPLLGDVVVNASSDFAYGWVSSGEWRTLYNRLTTLLPTEENVIKTVYLPALATLESAIPSAGENLDTKQAAVWTRNATEVRDRTRLFDDWRRRLCAFVGIAPGPALNIANGSVSLARA